MPPLQPGAGLVADRDERFADRLDRLLRGFSGMLIVVGTCRSDELRGVG